MKKKFFFLLCVILSLSCYANDNIEKKLCQNFARIILGIEPDKHIAVIDCRSYYNTSDMPKSKYNYLEAPNLSKFTNYNFRLSRITVLNSYGKKTDTIIFLVGRNFSLSHAPLPVLRNTKWVVILETMYKDGAILEKGSLKREDISKLKEFKFINEETLFIIPYQERLNGVCIEWDKKLFKIPNDIIQEEPSLANDIAIMYSILCTKKIDIRNVNILKSLYDIKSKLQTKIGLKIHTEVCNILKQI